MSSSIFHGAVRVRWRISAVSRTALHLKRSANACIPGCPGARACGRAAERPVWHDDVQRSGAYHAASWCRTRSLQCLSRCSLYFGTSYREPGLRRTLCDHWQPVAASFVDHRAHRFGRALGRRNHFRSRCGRRRGGMWCWFTPWAPRSFNPCSIARETSLTMTISTRGSLGI